VIEAERTAMWIGASLPALSSAQPSSVLAARKAMA
jgi:hypothetical protein